MAGIAASEQVVHPVCSAEVQSNGVASSAVVIHLPRCTRLSGAGHGACQPMSNRHLHALDLGPHMPGKVLPLARTETEWLKPAGRWSKNPGLPRSGPG